MAEIKGTTAAKAFVTESEPAIRGALSGPVDGLTLKLPS